MAFVHLHNHTEYSMLDGATKIKDMVRRAADLDMPAVAITDHGVMCGVPELCDACDAVAKGTGKASSLFTVARFISPKTPRWARRTNRACTICCFWRKTMSAITILFAWCPNRMSITSITSRAPRSTCCSVTRKVLSPPRRALRALFRATLTRAISTVHAKWAASSPIFHARRFLYRAARPWHHH